MWGCFARVSYVLGTLCVAALSDGDLPAHSSTTSAVSLAFAVSVRERFDKQIPCLIIRILSCRFGQAVALPSVLGGLEVVEGCDSGGF